jgi:hypothetical protein
MSGRNYCYRGRRKKKYKTVYEAQPRIDEVYSETKLRLYTYWCPRCKAVHLSKHAAPKQRNWR